MDKRYFLRQFYAIEFELSKLAIACDIDLGRRDFERRVLKNDHSVCGRWNEIAFYEIREQLMVLFHLEQQAIEALGASVTKDLLDEVRAAIIELRLAGSKNASLPHEN